MIAIKVVVKIDSFTTSVFAKDSFTFLWYQGSWLQACFASPVQQKLLGVLIFLEHLAGISCDDLLVPSCTYTKRVPRLMLIKMR